MSHYDEVLKEARAKATGSAAIYIPRLFKILVDEDKHTPEEARAIIEHDLISYWARTTIRKNLPVEAKDEIKAKAGKEGAKATNLVLAGGQTQQTETVTIEADDKMPAEPEEPSELELKDIRIAQLEDALHKISDKQFVPATQLQESPNEFNVDEAFQKLPDDNSMTCWKIPRISGNALKNKISAWQGNTNKIFRVWMQEV